MNPTLSWGGGEWEGLSSPVQAGTFRALNSLPLGLIQAKEKKDPAQAVTILPGSWTRNTYFFLHKGSGAQAEAAILALGERLVWRETWDREETSSELSQATLLPWIISTCCTHFLVYPLLVTTHTKGVFASTSGTKTACVTSKVTFLFLQKTLFSSLSHF